MGTVLGVIRVIVLVTNVLAAIHHRADNVNLRLAKLGDSVHNLLAPGVVLANNKYNAINQLANLGSIDKGAHRRRIDNHVIKAILELAD